MCEPARIGIIANPASGKDIRRVVAAGLVVSNHEKANIVARLLKAAAADGSVEALLMPDNSGLVRRIVAENREPGLTLDTIALNYVSGTAVDSERSAEHMREAGVGVIVTLGGDGTNRVVARAAGDVPLLPISTGTNNVFPTRIEGTLAGLAAKAIASGWVSRDEGCMRHPVLELVRDGEAVDKALVDIALVDGIDTGARAVWQVDDVRELFLTQAPPLAIGLAAIGSAADPMMPGSGEALHVVVGPGGRTLRVPFAPGSVVPVDVASTSRFAGTIVISARAGVVALDGEREHVVDPEALYEVRYRADGPWVVDVEKTLVAAARAGFPDVVAKRDLEACA